MLKLFLIYFKFRLVNNIIIFNILKYCKNQRENIDNCLTFKVDDTIHFNINANNTTLNI